MLIRFIRPELIKSRRYLSSKNSRRLIDVINRNDHVELTISDCPTPLKLTSHWLRMNCHSSHSKQHGSGQRIININTIPDTLTINELIHDSNRGYLIIKWHTDSNQPDTHIPIDFLLDQPTKTRDIFEPCRRIEFFDYAEIQTNRSQRFQWLWTIAKHGLCIVRNLPIRTGMVKNLAELISPVQNTIYGDVFDVKVDDDPINIAYSNVPLELHMDLMYYESAPGLQFLHCLEFDETICGGESIFLDVFKAVERFRERYPGDFDTLTRVPATFQKLHLNRNRPVMMVYRRPHIVVNEHRRVTAVNWSPPFEGPLTNVGLKDSKDYYSAYIKFAKFVNKNPDLIEYRLKPGEVACFNNRRVLHGRNGFENRGKAARHFQGCYVNIDEFKSEVYVSEFLERGENVDGVESVNQLEAHRFMYGNQDS